MTCNEALEMIGPYVDDDLPEEVRRRIERHFLTCRACSSEAETQRITKARLRDGIGEVTAPDAFRSRVLARVRADNPHVHTTEPETNVNQYQLPIGL
jgi:anti-sigma factor (TIGR02949 family)